MNRNTESHFSNVPKISVRRSKMDRSSSVKTTFNAGDLVPLKVYEVLPGDTVQMDLSLLVRMATPIYPIMDNCYLDTYGFYVPWRMVYDNYKAFWGENNDPWANTTEYEIPYLEAPANGWQEGTIADYMGIPTKVKGIKPCALPFRAYCRIWNEFFRDENLKANCHIYTDDTTRTGMNGTESNYNYVTGAEFGGKPLKVAKYHDIFTSALPSAQKAGAPISIPLGTVAPISGTPTGLTATTTLTGGGVTTTIDGQGLKQLQTGNEYTPAATADLRFQTNGTSAISNKPMAMDRTAGNASGFVKAMIDQNSITAGEEAKLQGFRNLYANVNGLTATSNYTRPTAQTTIGGTLAGLTADLSLATAATINDLRRSFALQQYYEQLSRSGSRYIEFLRGIFGVQSSDARMLRPTYLGGQRVPINIDQIIQTSSTDATSPQGNTAGFSCTINSDNMFTHSFEEHGFLMILAAVRVEHTYQQGLHRMWTRRKWSDFYNPYFQNLGEVGLRNDMIYAQGNSQDEETFGFQEYAAEYRYEPSIVTGYMRSNAQGSLDVWHFADDYNTLPRLSSEWIDEPTSNIDRTIAVTSQLTHQFIGDFYFKTEWSRAMPIYSIPGLQKL